MMCHVAIMNRLSSRGNRMIEMASRRLRDLWNRRKGKRSASDDVEKIASFHRGFLL
jgi:hypothetical protein